MRNTSVIRRGVTLVEMFVVLAIIGMLLCLLMPAINSAHDATRRTKCQANLHELGLAMTQFVNARKKLPDPPTAGTMSGWAIEILPFIEEPNLAIGLAGSPPVTSSAAIPFAKNRPPIMHCPAGYDGDSDIAGVPVSHYAASFHRGLNAAGMKIQRAGGWGIGELSTDWRMAWVESPEFPREGQPVQVSNWSIPHTGGFNVVWEGSGVHLVDRAWWWLPKSP